MTKGKDIVYDIETNGLLPEMDKVHIIVINYLDGSPPLHCTDHDKNYAPIREGLNEINKSRLRVGHNIYNFDEYALKKVYGDFYNPKGMWLDTLLLSRLIFPDIYGQGPNTYKIPKFLRMAHTLKAWGYRLGEYKGDYTGKWDEYNDEMMEYAKQDPVVTEKLFRFLMHPKRKPASKASGIEHQFAGIIARQEHRGFTFDLETAQDMQAEVAQRMAKIEEELIETYGSWWSYKTHTPDAAGSKERGEYDNDDDDNEEEVDEDEADRRLRPVLTYPAADRNVKMTGFPDITMRRFSKKTGKELKPYVGPPICTYSKDAPYVKIERVTFNPGSRTHIQKMLYARHKWRPTRFTKKTAKGGGGAPIVDDAELQRLATNIPEAQLLADYFLLSKRQGQVASGPQAWIKLARLDEETGEYRIHGRVITNGAITGRCTHSKPNLSQVPSSKKEWTEDKSDEDKQQLRALKGLPKCRSMFKPRKGWTLFGNDGAGLELAMLAHYLAPHDGGAYARVCEDPDMDNHAWTRDTIGTDIMGEGKPGREKSKTTIYALIYGGGSGKLGSIIIPQGSVSERVSMGNKVKEAMEDRFTGYEQLCSDIEAHVQEFGYLIGLDGRKLPIRKAHAALNTLLQSAGAVTMKQALIILDAELQKAGLIPGVDYEFVGNIHDEIQCEVYLPKPKLITLQELRAVNPKASLEEKISAVDFDAFTIYAKAANTCVTKAGQALGLRCGLRGDALEGTSWAETH